MDGFLWALAASAIGALTWLAYQHPKSYRRIGAAVIAAMTLAVAFVFAFVFGVQRASLALVPFLENAGSPESDRAIQALHPNVGQMILIYMTVLLYLSVLFGLRQMLGLKEEDQVPDQQRAEHGGEL